MEKPQDIQLEESQILWTLKVLFKYYTVHTQTQTRKGFRIEKKKTKHKLWTFLYFPQFSDSWYVKINSK